MFYNSVHRRPSIQFVFITFQISVFFVLGNPLIFFIVILLKCYLSEKVKNYFRSCDEKIAEYSLPGIAKFYIIFVAICNNII